MTEILTERWERLYGGEDKDMTKASMSYDQFKQENEEKPMNKDNFDPKAIEEDDVVEMRLCADIHAYDYGTFAMPAGADISGIEGRWGCYTIKFTDPEKYPDIEVQCEQEVDGKFPEYVRISDDEGNDVWEDSCVF